jgi:hypothetical protein
MATPESETGEHDTGMLDAEAIRGPLLQKVFGGNKEKLDNAIAEKEQAGALNEVSALRKIASELGRREIGEAEVFGYMLQSYQLQPNERTGEVSISVYLASKSGVRTLHARSKDHLPDPKKYSGKIKAFGDKQHWSGLTEFENVIYNTRSLYVAKDKTRLSQATQAEVGADLWDMSTDLAKITDGQHTWRAYIGAIFPVGVFENNVPVGNKPILENNGNANLRVGLTDTVDMKTMRPGQTKTFVQITSESQLRTFLGEYYDDTMLMGEPKDVARELRDAMNGFSVVVFGSGKTPQSPNVVKKFKVKEPKINIFGGRGVIAPWKVPRAA